MIIITLLITLCSTWSINAIDTTHRSAVVAYQEPIRYPGKLPLTPALRPSQEKEAILANLFFEHRTLRQELETVESELTQAAQSPEQLEYPIESFIEKYPAGSDKRKAALVLLGSLIEHNLQKEQISTGSQHYNPQDLELILGHLTAIQSQHQERQEQLPNEAIQRARVGAFTKYATYAGCALIFSMPFASEKKRLFVGSLVLSAIFYYKAPEPERAAIGQRMGVVYNFFKTYIGRYLPSLFARS